MKACGMFLFALFVICGGACNRQPAQQMTPLAQAQASQPAGDVAASTTGQTPAPPSGQTASATPQAQAPNRAQPMVASPDMPPALSREPQPTAGMVWIPSGTVLRVRLEETLDTRRNRPGDTFSALLMHPVVLDGAIIVPPQTQCFGHLVESKPSGRFRGHAVLSLSLDTFELHGRQYDIRTTYVGRESRGHKKRNWALMGGGSGVGTVLGAIAGGPAGALIGAGAGGAARAVGEAITGKKNVRLPVETPLAFRLRGAVQVAT